MSDMLEASWADAFADEAPVLMSPRRSGDDDELDEDGFGEELGGENPDDEFDDIEDLEEEDEDEDLDEDEDDEDDEDLDDFDDEEDDDFDDVDDDGFGDDDDV